MVCMIFPFNFILNVFLKHSKYILFPKMQAKLKYESLRIAVNLDTVRILGIQKSGMKQNS